MDPRNQDEASHEERVRRALNSQRGWGLTSESITLDGGATASIDGIDRKARVIVEIVHRTGKNKSARHDKVVADAAKLALVREALGTDFQAYIVCSGTPFVAHFQLRAGSAEPTTWAALALSRFDVNVIEVASEN